MKYSRYAQLKYRFLTAVCLLLCLLLTGCDQEEAKQMDESPNVESKKYQGTIIALGDSLTAGFGLAEDKAWPFILEEKLQANGYDWQVINAGISGETSSGALSRIKWIIAQQPDIVILETGANDGLRGIPVQVIRKNIETTVQMLQSEQITVVLAGMQLVRNMGPEYIRDFAAIYADIAEEHQVILIPFLLHGVGGEPSLNQEDTIHPNEEGHRRITETTYPHILKAIKKTQENLPREP